MTGRMKVKLLDLQGQYFSIRGEVRRALDEICDAQDFVLGPRVEQFEKNLAAYCQTKHAIGVSSGTDALLCAMMAMDIGPDDEVICPAFTFFASAGSIARLGARPVFCDIDPATFNLCAKDVKKRLTKKTRAIMPVHLFGQLADMESINAIAREHGLKVIEDAAQAIGAKRGGKPACGHGDVGCLSFYPTKNLGGFGDGGAICTNDDALAEKCVLLRVHGSGTKTYFHKHIGGMFRMGSIQAAVLDIKLKRLEGWHEARRANARLYEELLQGSGVACPRIDPANWSIYNQYVVRVADRDNVKKKLAEAGIGSAVYYPLALHEQECFSHLGHRRGDFPESEKACGEVLALPIYPELPQDQLRYVAAELRRITGG